MQKRERVMVAVGLLCAASVFAAACRCSTSTPGASEPTPTSQPAPPGPVSATNNHVVPNVMPQFSTRLSPRMVEALRHQMDPDAATPDGG
jgi:hypothetical protein